jgi:hypothetical protein
VISIGRSWAYRKVILLNLFACICLYVILHDAIISTFVTIRRMFLTQCSYSVLICMLHYNHFLLVDCDRSVDELKRTRLFARKA